MSQSLDGLGARMEIFEKLLHETSSQVSAVGLSIARLEERAEAEAKIIQALSDKLDGLAKCDDVDSLKTRVDALEKKPRENMTWLFRTGGAVLIASVLTWLLSRLLPPATGG